jgi:nucleotide-binding universal stress UspA family protein
LLPYGVPIPSFLKEQLQEQAGDLADQVAESLKGEFDVLMASLGLTISAQPIAGKATASWVEEEGRQVEVIKRHGRLSDLIAVAQPEQAGMLGVNSLKAALFHSGRPVLMCPDTDSVTPALGTHIAVAWNGSTEAARAVALNVGLLEAADKVTILTGGEEVYGTRAEDLASYLGYRGIKSEIRRFSVSHDAGKELLKQCADIGADLMIMGAYGNSHEREIVFGGNTQTIIDTARMPIVMVH